IAAYVEQASISQPLSVRDVVVMKEQEVPVDIIVAVLKRAKQSGNQVKPGEMKSGAEAHEPSEFALDEGVSIPPQVDRRTSNNSMDPESYEFWWYHYAYPRALAAANERVFSSYRPFLEYQFGYNDFYPPLVFGPQPSTWLPRSR
ncbi:MAG TPA: hypothetical protein VEC99_09555, partial [Clostridia bacterium]|nr:hypothetical protein [Clostridia bacterium]